MGCEPGAPPARSLRASAREKPVLTRSRKSAKPNASAEQLPRLHPQRLSEAVDVDEAHIILAALDAADIGAGRPATERHFLLAQPPRLPKRPHPRPNRRLTSPRGYRTGLCCKLRRYNTRRLREGLETPDTLVVESLSTTGGASGVRLDL